MSLTLHQLEITLNDTNMQLSALRESQALNMDLQTQNDLLRKKAYNFETKVEELTRKISFDKDQFESKISMLNMEIQRITYALRQRETEVEGLRTQLIQFTEVNFQSQ